MRLGNPHKRTTGAGCSILALGLATGLLLAGSPPARASAIIVHAVNPEGVILGSIRWIDEYAVRIYDGDTLIIGVYDENTYDTPIPLSAGPHTIRVTFNGLELEQSVLLGDTETRTLTFVFPRVEFPLAEWIDAQEVSASVTRNEILTGVREDDAELIEAPWGILLDRSLSTGPEPLTATFHHEIRYSLNSGFFRSARSTSATITDSQPSFAKATTGLTDGWYPPLESPALEANIPASTDFEWWYVQYRRHGLYPRLILSDREVAFPRLFDDTHDGQDILALLSAAQPYPWIRIALTGFVAGGGGVTLDHELNCCPGSVTASDEAETTIDYLKMASVPFSVTDFGISVAGRCGNGLVGANEECDDGNTVSGDCCSATCRLEPAGNPCDDGDACTLATTCDTAGACGGGSPLSCDDGDPCNGVETCSPMTGCEQGTPLDCRDFLACTVDECIQGLGCVFVPDHSSCNNDGDLCTAEVCVLGLGCLSFPLDDCDPPESVAVVPAGSNVSVPVALPQPATVHFSHTSGGSLTGTYFVPSMGVTSPLLGTAPNLRACSSEATVAPSLAQVSDLPEGSALPPGTVALWLFSLEGLADGETRIQLDYDSTLFRSVREEEALALFHAENGGWRRLPTEIGSEEATVSAMVAEPLSLFALATDSVFFDDFESGDTSTWSHSRP